MQFVSHSLQTYFTFSRGLHLSEKYWYKYIFVCEKNTPLFVYFEIASKKGKSAKAFASNFPKINQIAIHDYGLHRSNITIRKMFEMMSTFKWLSFLRCNSQSLRSRVPFYSTSGSYCVQSIYSKWHNRKHRSSWESNFLGAAAIR